MEALEWMLRPDKCAAAFAFAFALGAHHAESGTALQAEGHAGVEHFLFLKSNNAASWFLVGQRWKGSSRQILSTAKAHLYAPKILQYFLVISNF